MTSLDLSAAWEENARSWLAWTRTPGCDPAFSELNAPAFRALVPPAGNGTVEVGCGEGRVGRMLAEQGHRMFGLDSSPTLVEAAREAGGYEELVLGDATSLPWAADRFDLAVAFMCLMDMPNPAAAIREIARVLAPGGRFCIVVTHPLTDAADPGADYFSERPFEEWAESMGVKMRFIGRDRPLEHYTRALTSAGFVIEELREPQPSAETVARWPRLASAARRPWSLLIRARLV